MSYANGSGPLDRRPNNKVWNASKLQGIPVSSQLPISGQSLVYDPVSKSYIPKEVKAATVANSYLVNILNATTLIGSATFRLTRAQGSQLSAYNSYATDVNGLVLKVPFAPASISAISSPYNLYGYWLKVDSVVRISKNANSNSILFGSFLEQLWKLIVSQAYLGTTTGATLPQVYSSTNTLISNSALDTQTKINAAWDANSSLALPNLTGRSLFAAADTALFGVSGGAETVSLTANQNGPHVHSYYRRLASSGDNNNPLAIYADNGGASTTITTDGVLSSGTGTPHENMPPYAKFPLYVFAGWRDET